MPNSYPLLQVIDLSMAKEHLNVTFDDDDQLILQKIGAAQGWAEKFLGVTFQELREAEGVFPDPVREAWLQLVAHFYENREVTIIGFKVSDVSPGLFELLAPYRRWVF